MPETYVTFNNTAHSLIYVRKHFIQFRYGTSSSMLSATIRNPRDYVQSILDQLSMMYDTKCDSHTYIDRHISTSGTICVATFAIGFFFVYKDFLAINYVVATGCCKLTVLFSKRQYLLWCIS